MVLEEIKVIDKTGIDEAQVTTGDTVTIPSTAGTQEFFVIDAGEIDFMALSWRAFAEDWESDADAAFDQLLGDGGLQ